MLFSYVDCKLLRVAEWCNSTMNIWSCGKNKKGHLLYPLLKLVPNPPVKKNTFLHFHSDKPPTVLAASLPL